MPPSLSYVASSARSSMSAGARATCCAMPKSCSSWAGWSASSTWPLLSTYAANKPSTRRASFVASTHAFFCAESLGSLAGFDCCAESVAAETTSDSTSVHFDTMGSLAGGVELGAGERSAGRLIETRQTALDLGDLRLKLWIGVLPEIHEFLIVVGGFRAVALRFVQLAEAAQRRAARRVVRLKSVRVRRREELLEVDDRGIRRVRLVVRTREVDVGAGIAFVDGTVGQRIAFPKFFHGVARAPFGDRYLAEHAMDVRLLVTKPRRVARDL